MRLLPPLTAAAVALVLYVAVFERDRLTGGETMAPPAPAARQPDTAPAQDAAAAQPVSVVVLQSTARQVENAVIARGRTEAARQVEVRAQTSGLVVSEPLRRGAFVAAGQELCRLDPGTRAAQAAEAQARLSEARARLTQAETDFEAANRLNEGGFASETRRISAAAALESARAGLQSAEAAVAIARTEIERLSIAAPFEGLLETDTAELGALVQAGGACATVIQLNPIKIVGYLPEADVANVDVGAKAGARLLSGQEVAGRVTFLSRSADPATRTFRVEILVENTDLAIRDGQTAEILIAAEGVAAHLVPASALTLDGEGRLGLRLAEADDHAGFAPVTILRDTVEGALVTGLPDQARIVIVGQEYIREGTPLSVTYAEGAGQ